MSTWVLLRGLTRGSGHWGPFQRVLAERLDGARCIALELPGNGLLSHLRSPSSIDAMAAWCQQRVAELGVASPVHVLGVSMGAMVATQWAQRAPESLAGCVLVNSSFGDVSAWHRRLRPSSYGALLSIAAGVGGSARQEAAILRLTSRNATAAALVLDEWTVLRDAHPVSRANALRQLFAAARYRPARAAPELPLLVLASRADALVDPRCSIALAARWRCDCVLHPSAGHDLTLDDAEWVAARVREWSERGAHAQND